MRAVLEPSGLRRYDELNDAQGAMRAHWRPLIERLRANDSPDAVRRSLELTRRLIVENGVTYNVYADPQGADRPWALDPLPFVLPAAEWQTIEAGVAQRARLLNALLADLYGPQRLLAEGFVPAELPFGHPNYLWPCHDLRPVDGTWLHVYAADLARAPDGRWWLLADRTQAPSGAGYALENREILEQVHPEAIADMSVRRVRGFFGGLARRAAERGRRRSAAGGDPDARALQRDLLRARLPRAPARHAAGGRPRPHGARQHGVPQDARRPAPRAFHPAAPRRRLSAIRSSCAAIRRSVFPGCWVRCAPDASWSPMRSAPACWNPPPGSVSCRRPRNA